MNKKLSVGLRAAVLGSLLATLSACAITPKPLTPAELNKQAAADRDLMFRGMTPIDHPLTLAEAMARAIKYNFDARAKAMEEALALRQLDADKFALLPQLTASAGYMYRDRDLAQSSTSFITGRQSLEPSLSTERNERTANLSLSWNILDFGASYYTAHQNADRAMIARERARKTMHNLLGEVRTAYWRAVAAQELQPVVTKISTDAANALGSSQRIEKTNVKAPVDSLRYQSGLLENIRQLETVDQELGMAKATLAALIGAPPGTELKLASAAPTALPAWNISVEQMEELALMNNPDLREQSYQTRIIALETRRAMLRMLPGLSFDTSYHYDSNRFLVNNDWNTASTQISWNLMNLVSAPSQFRMIKANKEVMEARRLALRMAVLTQVHVATRKYEAAVRQYALADQIASVNVRITNASENRLAAGTQGELQRVSEGISGVIAQLRRYYAYAQAETEWSRMQVTIGQDMPIETKSSDLGEITAAVARAIAVPEPAR